MKNPARMKSLLFILALTYFTYVTKDFLLSASLLAMIFVHECGHLWAARRRGFKTKGIYLLPIGGVAIVEGLEHADRDDEAYIAVMGPIWGMAFSFLFFWVAHLTNSLALLKTGAMLCVVNIFNLAPINPLDGGRIFKSITFSISRRVGLIAMMLMVPLAIFIGFRYGIFIFHMIALICYLDYRNEKRTTYSDYEVKKLIGETEKDGVKVVIEKPEKKKMSIWKMIAYSIVVALLLISACFPIGAFIEAEDIIEKAEKLIEESVDK